MTFLFSGVEQDDVYENYFKEYIAHGALVNSKRSESFIKGVYPACMTRASGCHTWDSNGNRYIDYICANGTNWFGYGNKQIAEAMYHQSLRGTLFSVGSNLEIEVGKHFQNLFTHLDRMRFLKSGSEGCVSAVKIARTFTGKKMVLSQGYHGHGPEFVSLTTPANGCPDTGNIKELNPDLSQIDDTIAAVIIEPIIIDYSTDRIDWLMRLRDKCKKHKVLLIFDETITAYRFPKFSIARTYNINPDIAVQGKAIANGMPLSIIGGRKDVMEADYFVSTTHAGETLTLAAALSCLKLVVGDYHPSAIWEKGKDFMEQFNSINRNIQLKGYPTRGIIWGATDLYKSLFMQEMCKAGVLLGASWFYSLDLDKEKENVLDIARTQIDKINKGEVKLNGPMPQSPFAQKVRKL